MILVASAQGLITMSGMRTKIIVKQKHIKGANRASRCNCAVARAVKDQMGISLDNDYSDDDWVEVDSDGIEVWKDNTMVQYLTASRKMVKYINAFDDGKNVKPEEFTLIQENYQ